MLKGHRGRLLVGLVGLLLAAPRPAAASPLAGVLTTLAMEAGKRAASAVGEAGGKAAVDYFRDLFNGDRRLADKPALQGGEVQGDKRAWKLGPTKLDAEDRKLLTTLLKRLDGDREQSIDAGTAGIIATDGAQVNVGGSVVVGTQGDVNIYQGSQAHADPRWKLAWVAIRDRESPAITYGSIFGNTFTKRAVLLGILKRVDVSMDPGLSSEKARVLRKVEEGQDISNFLDRGLPRHRLLRRLVQPGHARGHPRVRAPHPRPGHRARGRRELGAWPNTAKRYW